MTPDQFDNVARTAFAEVLNAFGFEVHDSKHCTFYRRVSADIWHFVMPDPGSTYTWYDIKVFATSPLIEPLFGDLFPDALGIPADVYCFLHPDKGITERQYQYHCKSEAGFNREFDRLVRGALSEKALPYLDGLSSLSSLIPHIRNKLYLGLALHECGQRDAARSVLRIERAKLEAAGESDRKVAAFLARVRTMI